MLTKSEATAVHTLLRWLTDPTPNPPITAEHLEATATFLAERVNKAVAAGQRPGQVAAALQALQPRIVHGPAYLVPLTAAEIRDRVNGPAEEDEPDQLAGITDEDLESAAATFLSRENYIDQCVPDMFDVIARLARREAEARTTAAPTS